MRLRLRHLELIDAIDTQGTLTRAALRLHLTQPAASRALQSLETALGIRLFHRGPRGMRATSAGRRLLHAARPVLRELERAQRVADTLGDRQGVVLRLATQCYTCYHWLPGVLQRARERIPDMELTLVPEATVDPLEHLRAGDLDVALVYEPPTQRDLDARELFRDELVALVPPRHPWTGRPFVEAASFSAETVLFHSDPAGAVLTQEVLAPAGVVPAHTRELPYTDAILASVAAGLGVTVVSRWAATPWVEEGRLCAVSVTRHGLYRRWFAVTPRGTSEAPAYRTLMEIMERAPLATGSPV